MSLRNPFPGDPGQPLPERDATSAEIIAMRAAEELQEFLPDAIHPDFVGEGGIVSHNALRAMTLSDSFGLLEHSDVPEVRKRQVAILIENLIEDVASDSFAQKRKLLQSRNKGGTFEMPEVSIGEGYTFALSATYGGDASRTYELKRTDEFASGNEGFRIIKDQGGSVIIRRISMNGGEEPDDKSQEELFEDARIFISNFSELYGKRRDEIKIHVQKSSFPSEVSKILAKRLTGSKETFSAAWEKRPKANKLAKSVGVVAVLYAHLLHPSADAELKGVPMPLPIEFVNDILNSPDHDAQGIPTPTGAREIPFTDEYAIQIPFIQDLLSETAPDLFHDSFFPDELNDGKNRLREGTWRITLNAEDRYAGEYPGTCDFVYAPRGKNIDPDANIYLWTDDQTVAESVVARRISPNTIRLCSVTQADDPDPQLPEGRLFISLVNPDN